MSCQRVRSLRHNARAAATRGGEAPRHAPVGVASGPNVSPGLANWPVKMMLLYLSMAAPEFTVVSSRRPARGRARPIDSCDNRQLSRCRGARRRATPHALPASRSPCVTSGETSGAGGPAESSTSRRNGRNVSTRRACAPVPNRADWRTCTGEREWVQRGGAGGVARGRSRAAYVRQHRRDVRAPPAWIAHDSAGVVRSKIYALLGGGGCVRRAGRSRLSGSLRAWKQYRARSRTLLRIRWGPPPPPPPPCSSSRARACPTTASATTSHTAPRLDGTMPQARRATGRGHPPRVTVRRRLAGAGAKRATQAGRPAARGAECNLRFCGGLEQRWHTRGAVRRKLRPAAQRPHA